VIRTVAVTIICLGGLGVFAAAGKKSAAPPPTEIVFPVAVGDKADRLPMSQNILADADKVDVAYIPSAEQSALTRPGSPARKTARTDPVGFIPRHWHDPHDPKGKAAKAKSGTTKQSRTRSPDMPVTQASNATECRSDRLQSLLKTLNLFASDSC